MSIVDDLERMLRPLRVRMANMISRGVVQRVNDGKKLQLVQIGGLAGETIDDTEHAQPYGFASVPLEGAEVVTIFPGGDRGHPITIAAFDRRYRPTGAQPGEVVVYNHTGAKFTMTKDGDIIATPAPGRTFKVTDASGVTDGLVTKTEFNAHLHTSAAAGSPTTIPTVPAAGTTVLKGK